MSERALEKKGIKTYFKNVAPDIMSARIVFGFLNKRSKGKVKYFQKRWCVLISSRPLMEAKYIEDDFLLKDSCLPAWMEFDTLYYFTMENDEDDSTARGEIAMK